MQTTEKQQRPDRPKLFNHNRPRQRYYKKRPQNKGHQPFVLNGLGKYNNIYNNLRNGKVNHDRRNYHHGTEDYSFSHTAQSEGESTPIGSSVNDILGIFV